MDTGWLVCICHWKGLGQRFVLDRLVTFWFPTGSLVGASQGEAQTAEHAVLQFLLGFWTRQCGRHHCLSTKVYLHQAARPKGRACWWLLWPMGKVSSWLGKLHPWKHTNFKVSEADLDDKDKDSSSYFAWLAAWACCTEQQCNLAQHHRAVASWAACALDLPLAW